MLKLDPITSTAIRKELSCSTAMRERWNQAPGLDRVVRRASNRELKCLDVEIALTLCGKYA